MQLSVIGSNSAGNAYLLQSDIGETLLIECGVSMSAIKKALDFNLRDVAAVVSHSHGDHALSIREVANAGIPVYAGAETLAAKGLTGHHRVNEITAGSRFNVMGFSIMPFSVNHDVPCLGFLIRHLECGLTLFLTDTFYCDYTFPGLNNIIVECNHALDIIDSNKTPGFLRDRIIQSHMSLKTCKELLAANDLTQVNNIVLIHLSDSNSDEARFKREVEDLTGRSVHIAVKGLSIPFNKTAI